MESAALLPPAEYFPEQPWAATSESILVWDEAFHDLMLGDRLRMAAYRKAIFEVVRPGQHVIDLGVGSGILSRWAIEAGAARVTGIEMSAHMLNQAVAMLHKAGLDDRFVPVNKLSFEVDLPEPADVLISEIIGNLGDNENFQPILNDAIRRLLKPGGSCIPLSVDSYIVPVAAREAHRSLADGRVATLSENYRAEALSGRQTRSLFDLYYDCVVPERTYLSRPALLRRYSGDWDQPATYDAELRFEADRPGPLTGFKGYFVAQLSEATALDISGDDIAAGTASDSWKHAYLPIESPVEIEAGDTIALTFSRHYRRDTDTAFAQIYSWKGEVVRRGEVAGRFSQSTA